MAKGYFSLIQYSPDPSRREAANIGVVLFCPEERFLKVRMSQDNARVRQFFQCNAPGDAHLDAMKASFVAQLEASASNLRTVEDLATFAETLANSIVMTPPRWVKVVAPDQTLAESFEELVLAPGLTPLSAPMSTT